MRWRFASTTDYRPGQWCIILLKKFLILFRTWTKRGHSAIFCWLWPPPQSLPEHQWYRIGSQDPEGAWTYQPWHYLQPHPICLHFCLSALHDPIGGLQLCVRTLTIQRNLHHANQSISWSIQESVGWSGKEICGKFTCKVRVQRYWNAPILLYLYTDLATTNVQSYFITTTFRKHGHGHTLKIPHLTC